MVSLNNREIGYARIPGTDAQERFLVVISLFRKVRGLEIGTGDPQRAGEIAYLFVR